MKVNCINCGKMFECVKRRLIPPKYCCLKCGQEYRRYKRKQIEHLIKNENKTN